LNVLKSAVETSLKIYTMRVIEWFESEVASYQKKKPGLANFLIFGKNTALVQQAIKQLVEILSVTWSTATSWSWTSTVAL